MLHLALVLAAAQGASFELADGDRTVLLGNTFFERDLRHNHLEARLTSRHPGRTLVFRNLGWDGDTVFGESRAGFGTAADGYRALLRQVADAKPTVILIAYGFNESFAGPGGLPAFREQLARLLEALAPHKARIVLIGPHRQEPGPAAVDVAARNEALRAYADTLAAVAASRGLPFIDLLKEESLPTENGIHLGEAGYRRVAAAIDRALGGPPREWRVRIDIGRASGTGENTAVSGLKTDLDRVTFTTTDPRLPAAGDEDRVLYVAGLRTGRYVLKADGREVASGSADEWARGVTLTRGPELAQAEALRSAIAAKNALFFHAWRPQNETYIFGFRKREQGHLQAEFPQFVPLIAEKEAEIARLAVPAPHVYVLEPEK